MVTACHARAAPGARYVLRTSADTADGPRCRAQRERPGGPPQTDEELVPKLLSAPGIEGSAVRAHGAATEGQWLPEVGEVGVGRLRDERRRRDFVKTDLSPELL